MNRSMIRGSAFAAALVLVGVGAYLLGHRGVATLETAKSEPSTAASGASGAERKVLYWYDPMYPQQHFEKPGRSPFMEMQLLPKYADDQSGGAVKIDPALAQNLGIRVATVEAGRLASTIDAAATIGFNERDIAIIQARTGGFVERVYARAPGDVVAAGAAIVDVLVPEWSAAQSEFLALQATGDASLASAARDRLKLLGMPDDLIERVIRTKQPSAVLTITTPLSGVIQSLDVRDGMTIAPGMTLARVNGLATVWIEAAVPETHAAAVTPGTAVEARLPAFPGEVFKGNVAAVLPQANAETRTLRVRAEFSNPRGRLRPGMYAQVRILAKASRETTLIPTEAVIRTGKRALVIVAADGGGYQPTEIELGAEADGKVAVTKGLNVGQKIVVSGQFLIDSEASLSASLARIGASESSGTNAELHQAQGKIVKLTPEEITLAHGPVPSINWGAMTMSFKVARPELLQGLSSGDAVKFAFRRDGNRVVVEQIERVGEAR